jgi:transcriptional regulator with XRE-family HTH domain
VSDLYTAGGGVAEGGAERGAGGGGHGGWSQAELAPRSGVPQPTISRIEAGSVNLDNLERLAAALGVNAAVLIAPEQGRGR